MYGLNSNVQCRPDEQMYKLLRKQVIDEFLNIAKDNIMMHSEYDKARVYASVGINDPKKNYVEIQYARQKDADYALNKNLKEYSLGHLKFTIGVKMKEKTQPQFIIRVS